MKETKNKKGKTNNKCTLELSSHGQTYTDGYGKSKIKQNLPNCPFLFLKSNRLG